jgi:hypothetical protein
MSVDISATGWGWSNFGFVARTLDSHFNLVLFNYGDTESEAFSVRAYLSLDNKIGSSDYVILDHRFGGLPANSTSGDIYSNVALPMNVVGGQLSHPGRW